MAQAPEITVAVETAVHNALAEVAQAIYRQHGILVHAARFDWIDVSRIDEQRRAVTTVSLETSKAVQWGDST